MDVDQEIHLQVVVGIIVFKDFVQLKVVLGILKKYK